MIESGMAQNKYFQIFKPLKRVSKDPYNHTFVPCKTFYIKFDPRRKARLVTVVNMTGASDEYAYCGVVNIHTLRTVFFCGYINGVEVAVMYFGNT